MNQDTNEIVVGVDGSPSAEVALTWAADEANRRGAGLHLVQAYWVSTEYAGPGALIPPSLFDDARTGAEQLVAAAAAEVHARHPELRLRTTVLLEPPFVALRDASEHALLTVLGSHGAGVVSETLLGSVAQKMASHSRSPFVVVRTDPHDAPPAVLPAAAPVVVGLDGSADSDEALAFALGEASFRGVPLVAVHSWDDKPLGGFLRVYPMEIDHDAIDRDEGRVLAEQLAGWSTRYPDVPVTQLIRRGSPAGELLRSAAELHACLLVVGTRGRGGFTGLLLGSTSAALVAYASCPVAVVRPSQ
jgi:nucleotide-binding universal stress UspA family protein